jgi:hypothetical protein
VLFVIAGKYRVRGRAVGNGWIGWRGFHGAIRRMVELRPLHDMDAQRRYIRIGVNRFCPQWPGRNVIIIAYYNT